MIKRFEQFVSGISICYKHIQRIKAMEMPELEEGLKGSHVMCLFYLAQNPQGLSAAELCSLCMEDKAAISRTVAELTEKGFAEYAQGAKRYRAPLLLTAAGKTLAARVENTIAHWVDVGGEGLSEEQREAFYSGLERISGNLQDKYGEKTR